MEGYNIKAIDLFGDILGISLKPKEIEELVEKSTQFTKHFQSEYLIRIGAVVPNKTEQDSKECKNQT